ncbi:UDP-N-acetylmuramoyl-L-alanine--D-glutamate ligase [Rhodococcus sp. TAF43]|uniref:UDP-N-acetylmuramoyl-L-alanine--D-glutamate ligase n=1 Tax=unclassified Rhodococcus (in: high G+C Gram-positive bacteria) TaxID=192944 RepID=UPI00158395E0|nr:UDP-N-acetylmuramoyl-L-alanine--D-glutamate ligase [Rhodococcus sp. W8901]QKT12036.1 UDP-N-acetylmuramoyl-L-alanine--D-glutamate ligase [Rhodococcus sp. W8901]
MQLDGTGHDAGVDAGDLDRLRGASVLVTGAGISGRAVIAPLHDLGARVTVTDTNVDALARCAELGAETVPLDDLVADPARVAEFVLVVTSPGFRPDAPVLAAATAAGIPIWGDIEFTWHVDRAGVYGPPRQWLVVTGTNGKTTTTSMLHSILEAADMSSAACGNIGLPVLDALRAQEPRVDVLAVELSSFQLHWAPSVRPTAGVVLNIAEDHLDWHGGMEGYTDAKAQALTGGVAVVGLDDAVAATLVERPRDGHTVGFRLDAPDVGELGVRGGMLIDRAFADSVPLVAADEISPPGPAGLCDALAAAALARAIGVSPAAVDAGLRAHRVGPHRAEVVRRLTDITFIDDSKATNPHAARSSIVAHDSVVWIAGGLLKGARIDDLVADVADRLAGAVLIGRDADQIAEALARHAPEVPVVHVRAGDDGSVVEPIAGADVLHLDLPAADADTVMAEAVRAATALAAPGDTVLLAPAAASLDMFDSYGHRGRSFAAAVTALADIEPESGTRG